MIDVAPRRQLHAAPEPGSRWTGFAQGVRTVTERAKEATSDSVEATRLIFTSKMTWAILVGGIFLGMWVQNKIETVNQVGASQAEILTTVTGIKNTLQTMRDDSKDAATQRAALANDIRRVEEELKRQERERRLLQDYVEGRVGKMPYQPPGG